jgi:hypothetical protein
MKKRTYALQPERSDNPGCHVDEKEADCFVVYDTTPKNAPSPGMVAIYHVQPSKPESMGRIDASNGAGAVVTVLNLGGPLPTGKLPTRTRFNPADVERFAAPFLDKAAAARTIDAAAAIIQDAAGASFGDVAGMVYSGLDNDREWRALDPEERRELVGSQLDGELTQLRYEAEGAARSFIQAAGFVEDFNVYCLSHASGWRVWVSSSDGGLAFDEWDYCVGLYPPPADCVEDAALLVSRDSEGGPDFLESFARVMIAFQAAVEGEGR